jgi:ABC-type hemin transport system ATPase subunit
MPARTRERKRQRTEVLRQLTARTGSFVSVTTSSHCNLAASYADRVFDTPMEIEMNTHLFSVIDQ